VVVMALRTLGDLVRAMIRFAEAVERLIELARRAAPSAGTLYFRPRDRGCSVSVSVEARGVPETSIDIGGVRVHTTGLSAVSYCSAPVEIPIEIGIEPDVNVGHCFACDLVARLGRRDLDVYVTVARAVCDGVKVGITLHIMPGERRGAGYRAALLTPKGYVDIASAPTLEELARAAARIAAPLDQRGLAEKAISGTECSVAETPDLSCVERAAEAAERLVESWPLVEPAVRRCYTADVKAVALLRALP